MDWNSFNFEYRLDMSGLLSLILDIEAHRRSAANLVLPPDWRDQLDRLNRVRAVYGTTALEGNPLSEEEVSHQIEVVEQPNIQNEPNKPTREQLQIRNASTAQNWVKLRFFPNAPPLTVEDILKLHRMATVDSDTKDNIPGEFRTWPVQVGSADMGGVHKGAPHERLRELMEQFVEHVNSRKFREGFHPVIRALLSHFLLVTLHPFGDGNGRVSRLVEAGILFEGEYNVHGFYGLSNYFYKNERAYKTSLQQCRATQPFDVTPFIVFGLKGFAAELKGINNFIKAKLNRVIYRAMLVRAFNRRIGSRRKLLNQREYSLLNFLLLETEPTDPFSEIQSKKIRFSELSQASYVKGAYRNVTPRTFYRELIRLGELGFISFTREETAKDWVLELDFDAIGKY